MADAFHAIRSWFVSGNAPPIDLPEFKDAPAAGIKSVHAISGLRNLLGSFAPSRIWADVFITVVLAALIIFLSLSILTSCRQLGWAMIKLAFMCSCSVIVVYWLYTVWLLSDSEFHSTYADSVAWIYDGVRDVALGGNRIINKK